MVEYDLRAAQHHRPVSSHIGNISPGPLLEPDIAMLTEPFESHARRADLEQAALATPRLNPTSTQTNHRISARRKSGIPCSLESDLSRERLLETYPETRWPLCPEIRRFDWRRSLAQPQDYP